MEVTEFQVESKPKWRRARRLEPPPDTIAAGHNLPSAAESLLLGLRLRGWLADSEKILLDQLAVDSHIAFLLVGNEYVHPEGINLFPLDVIGVAGLHEGQATFRHNYRPDGVPNNSGYTIHTARLGNDSNQPVILGMFGPDGVVPHQALEDRFSNLVDTFRQAFGRAERTCTELKARLDNSVAGILINRCSGRIIDVNSRAADVLKADPRDLVDLEYTHFKDRLTPAFLGFGHTLTNLNIGDQRFVLITRCERVAPRQDSEQSLAGFFIDRCLTKIANCTMATSHLQEIMNGMSKDEEKGLAEVILGELGDVSRRLHRFTSLFRYHELPRRTLNPVLELERAIHQIRTHSNKEARFSVAVKGTGTTLEAPEMALVHLFESIMLSHHLADSNGEASTHVSVQSPASEGRMSAVFVTDPGTGNSVTGFHPDWSRYSDELADTMKLHLNRQFSADSSTMTTTILFP